MASTWNHPRACRALITQAGAGSQIEVTYLAGGETRQAKVALQDAPGAAATTPPRNTPLPIAPHRTTIAPGPPLVDRAAPGGADREEIESLKHRVQELEQRIAQLEQAAKGGK